MDGDRPVLDDQTLDQPVVWDFTPGGAGP